MALQTGWPSLPPLQDLLRAIMIGILQSALSTFLSLVLGIWGAFGLCSLRRSTWLAAADLLVLLRVCFPTLFVLLGILSFVTYWTQFPFGVTGVILVHVWIHAGLVAVALSRLLRARLGGQIELAWVEGASILQFFRKGFLPQLKNEVFIIALVVFSFCLTSLAVPLIAGGPQAATLDIYAYQQVHYGSGLKAAIGIAWIEMLLLAYFGRLTARPTMAKRQEVRNLRFLRMPLGLLFLLVLSLILIVSCIWSGRLGQTQYQMLPDLQLIFEQTIQGTFWVSFLTGLSVAGLIALTAFVYPHLGFRHWLLSLSSPSTMLVGLAFFALGPALGFAVWPKIIIGLTLLSFPALYRWLIDAGLEDLQTQIQVARTLGASWVKIWSRLTLPQLAPEIGLAAALAALWAAGDFALSGLIASQNITLAMVIEGLLSAYRLELATWLMGWLMVLALLIAGLFIGAGYVFGRKLKS